MANIQGNRIALEDVFLHVFPAQASIEHVQEPIGMGRDPFLVVESAAGAAWKKIDCQGYEVLFLAGDNIQQMGGEPAYVKFGQQGPSDISGTAPSGIPVLAGSKIKVPQGFKFLYFLASTDTNWRIVITKIPCVETDYGPYGWSLPPDKLISITPAAYPDGDAWSYPVPAPLTNDIGGTPATTTSAVKVPSRAKKMAIRWFTVGTGGAVTPIVAATSGAMWVYWWLQNSIVPNGVGLWCKNANDNFTSSARGEISITHDVELYDCFGQDYFCLVDPTGWTTPMVPATGSLGFEVAFYG